MTDTISGVVEELSLSTEAARSLATTTKTVPQMQTVTPRWLLAELPWVEVEAGAFRVNRPRRIIVGDGRITAEGTDVGDGVRVVPPDLRELRLLRAFRDNDTLEAMADLFTRDDYEPGDVIVHAGQVSDQLMVVARGKVEELTTGPHGDEAVLALRGEGDHFGQEALTADSVWERTRRAVTKCVVLSLDRRSFEGLAERSGPLRNHLTALQGADGPGTNGSAPGPEGAEWEVSIVSGHDGTPTLPLTYVDYERPAREYELSLVQTVLRMHSRVADLFSEPIDQLREQLRLAIESIREQQEHEILNNRDFGLLNNVAFSQRIQTRTGPPTPDDLDELLSRVWKEPTLFLAHPRSIAAFGRECTRRGVPPPTIERHGNQFLTWRGVPLLPCDKIPVVNGTTSQILCMRLGESNRGVVGLRKTGLDGEHSPGLSVRLMGLDANAIASYLLTAYFSAAVLVEDALAVLEGVEVARYHDFDRA